MPSMKTFDKTRNDSARTRDSVVSESEVARGKTEQEAERQKQGVKNTSKQEWNLQEWDVIDVKRVKRKKKGVKSVQAKPPTPQATQSSSHERLADEQSKDNEKKAEESNGDREDKKVEEKEKGSQENGLRDVGSEMNGDLNGAGLTADALIEEELNEWGDFEGSAPVEDKDADNCTVQRRSSSGNTTENRVNHFEEDGTQVKDDYCFGPAGNGFQSTLIQSCVRFFQRFFAEFVNQIILRETSQPFAVQESPRSQRKTNADIAVHANTDELLNEDFLTPRAPNKGSSSTQSAAPIDLGTLLCTRRNHQKTSSPATANLQHCAEAFAAACKLLVEFSCFPIYCGAESSSCSLDWISEGICLFCFFGWHCVMHVVVLHTENTMSFYIHNTTQHSMI